LAAGPDPPLLYMVILTVSFRPGMGLLDSGVLVGRRFTFACASAGAKQGFEVMPRRLP
jgi:hypothetical protein